MYLIINIILNPPETEPAEQLSCVCSKESCKIEVEISIHKDSVYVVIGCEQGAPRTELEIQAPVLEKNLGLNDLQLASLRFQALRPEQN